MALFPGAKGGDILSWRGVAEAVGELTGRSAERMSYALVDEGIDLLKGVRERLEEEISFEERFSSDFSQAMEMLALARYEDDLAPLLPRFDRLAEEYFRKRGSVAALHTFFSVCRDGLLRRALQLVEEWLALEEARRAPAPYCWLASGSIGRSEQTFCVDPSYFLIYEDTSGDGYFETFAYRAVALLKKIGLMKEGGAAAAMKNLWRGGRTEWRREIVEEMAAEDRARFPELVRRADLRLIFGDEALSGEMINVVRSMLEFHRGALRESSKSAAIAARTRAAFSFPVPALRGMGKEIAEMPTGLDFFSRLRVERSGSHRGEFDLEQFALAPLVTNIRMLTINCALHETSTIDRIKGLQERGHLDVDLTERLLLAYHDFTRLKVIRQLAGGCEDEGACFIDPQGLTADEESRLRNGLEAVTGLEKIAYLLFTEKG